VASPTLNRIAVDGLDHPALAPYRTLRRPEEQVRSGVFIAESGPVVERLLDTDLECLSALLTPQWLERLGDRLAPRLAGAPVFVAPHRVLEGIIAVHIHQGVMVAARAPRPRPLGEIVTRAAPPRLLLALDGVTNPENLGTIARSCAALAADALVVGETSATPWLRRSVRTSMGAVFVVPVCHVTDLVATVRELSGRGIRCLAAAPRAATRLDRAELAGDCCLLLGHEGYGLRPEVAAACDGAVAIPMTSAVDSLNVAAAAAVLLYEAVRQRGVGDPRPGPAV
jgi:tRNA G18 (ribose-2'-O)-methylase SpoU